MVNQQHKIHKRGTRRLPAHWKLFLDFSPLAVFFFGYKFIDLTAATELLVGATIISLVVIYAVERTIAAAPLVSAILVGTLGAMTILLKDDMFIKIKPTLVNLLFSVTLLTGAYGFKRGLLHYVLDVAINLTEEGWCALSRRWGFFFLFLAGLNEVIWRSFSTAFWVDFKVFGMLSLTMLFALLQLRLIRKYSIAAS